MSTSISDAETGHTHFYQTVLHPTFSQWMLWIILRNVAKESLKGINLEQISECYRY